MLESGVNPNSHERSTKTSALIYASKWGHLNVVRVLLAYGAQVDFRDASNYTAEDWATWYRYWDICKLLKDQVYMP